MKLTRAEIEEINTKNAIKQINRKLLFLSRQGALFPELIQTQVSALEYTRARLIRRLAISEEVKHDY